MALVACPSCGNEVTNELGNCIFCKTALAAPVRAEARWLTQQINGILGNMDTAGRLKSALSAAKTRSRNAIKDLQAEIDTGTRIVAGKSVLMSDPELDALRAELAERRKVEATVFARPDLTDEHRLKRAIYAAEHTTASWATRLEQARKGVFGGKEAPPMSSPELAALRAKAKAEREEYNELKSLDLGPSGKTPDEIRERMQERIEEGIDGLSPRGTRPHGLRWNPMTEVKAWIARIHPTGALLAGALLAVAAALAFFAFANRYEFANLNSRQITRRDRLTGRVDLCIRADMASPMVCKQAIQ